MGPSYLVVLFQATGGKSGEDLGSDEEQICLFVYLLYDVTNNKVVAVQTHYVRPTTDDLSEPVLTDECKLETGLSEEAVRNAQPLEHVLDEFDRFISSKEIHPDHGGRPFCFCTDGQLHMRLLLHPEATNKNINLAKYFHKFFDLRKEFKKFYKFENVNNIKDMLEYLGLEEDQSVEYGVRQCQEMGRIIHRLINDGHTFLSPEVVNHRLEPGICNRSDIVDEDCVIRARGLPWQSSDQDIAKFFKGLNIAKGGVALCLSKQGRRNGEALIRFDSKEHRDLALRKHKHHLKQRYIEVYKAAGKDFVNVAGGNNSEAQTFLSRNNCHDQTIVRMRGLPYTATAEQVLSFFVNGDIPCNVLDGEEGILFVRHPDGRSTGDAFVLFPDEDEANKALMKHKQCIGTRYIELFKSTTAEVQQVLNNTAEGTTQEANGSQPLISQIPQIFPTMAPQQAIICGNARDCIRLRGLPFEATVSDILTFLGEHSRNIVFHGVHMVYNAPPPVIPGYPSPATQQGCFSGEAFIQMNSELAAESAAINRHKKYMILGNKKRYIEVIQCSGEDMNMILAKGLPSAQPTQPQLPPQPTLPQMIQAPRHLLSPTGTPIPTVPSSYPQMNLNPYMQQLSVQQAQMAHPTMTATSPVPPSAMSPTMPQAATVPAASAQRPGAHPYYAMNHMNQPILYWYPSPPVSPQSNYYVHSCPTVVVMKDLPQATTQQDLLSFFDGVYEIQPDIQIPHGIDGRPTGEAYVTFASRIEAERAVAERMRKPFGNRYVEMLIAQ